MPKRQKMLDRLLGGLVEHGNSKAHAQVVRTPKSRTALEALLHFHHVPYVSWTKGRLEELWREAKDGETVFEVDGGRLIRSIRTLTLRIFYDRPARTPGELANERRLFLREWVQRHDSEEAVRRAHANSLSEKLKWQERGDMDAVKRAFLEELCKMSTHKPVLLNKRDIKTVLLDTSYSVERVPLHESSKYPGLLTKNELHPHICILRDVHFDPEGYYELRPDRVSYFRWEPVAGQRKD